MDSKAYWVGFSMVKGVGAVRFRGLLQQFGSLDEAWKAPADYLREYLPAKSVEQLLSLRQEIDLERVMEDIHAAGIQVLTWEDETYPRRLYATAAPPPVLYIRGELIEEDDLAVAVVGTRKMTPYGRQVAEELAEFLSRNSITVVSGLARGVDAAAHRAAIKAGGRTLAVLGCGVDVIYPPENRNIANEIIHRGAMISDYAPGTPPDSVNFPPRNRIIAGLSMAVVVVEAGEKSGSLITATFAAEQGREVFAVPGNIYNPQSIGTNRLIREGAIPLTQMEDILNILHLTQTSEKRQARRLLPENDVERELLQLLVDQPLHVDEIGNQCGIPVNQVSAVLVMMELKGLVRQVQPMSYIAIREQREIYQVNHDG